MRLCDACVWRLPFDIDFQRIQNIAFVCDSIVFVHVIAMLWPLLALTLMLSRFHICLPYLFVWIQDFVGLICVNTFSGQDYSIENQLLFIKCMCMFSCKAINSNECDDEVTTFVNNLMMKCQKFHRLIWNTPEMNENKVCFLLFVSPRWNWFVNTNFPLECVNEKNTSIHFQLIKLTEQTEFGWDRSEYTMIPNNWYFYSFSYTSNLIDFSISEMISSLSV